jgi:hypothetical protein
MIGTWLRNTLPLKLPLKISLNIVRATVFRLFLGKLEPPHISPTAAHGMKNPSHHQLKLKMRAAYEEEAKKPK